MYWVSLMFGRVLEDVVVVGDDYRIERRHSCEVQCAREKRQAAC